MVQEVKLLIENKLKLIDDCNKWTSGEMTPQLYKLSDELTGIKECLYAYGIILDLDINANYYKNNKPSTYKIFLQ